MRLIPTALTQRSIDPNDPTGGQTIDALRARQVALQEAQAKAPAQIASPWQGLAFMADRLVNNVQQRRAADAEAAGRQRLAQLMSGINYDTGASPAQIAGISTLDPELGTRMVADAIRARRELLQQQHQDAMTREGWTQQEKMLGQRQAFDASQTAAAQAHADAAQQAGFTQQQKMQGSSQDFQRQQAEDAQAHADQTQQAQFGQQDAMQQAGFTHQDQAAARAAAVDAAKPKSSVGQIETDFKNGIYGDPTTPEAQKMRDDALNKATTVIQPGGAADRKALWAQQDDYVNTAATLGQLNRASSLLKQGINTGYGSSAVTTYGAMGLPGGDAEQAKRTKEYNNIMNQEAILAMSGTLKGATSDKEMAEFIRNMNDPTLDPATKSGMIDRLVARAQSNQELQAARIRELGGDIPQPQAAVPTDVEAQTLNDARDAIAKGAPAEMVRKRLVDKGIDPGKL